METNTPTKNIAEKYLNGEVKIINAIPYTVSTYIRCVGKHLENILGRWRLAFIRCPKCRKHMGIYQDELSVIGQTKAKKCSCGYNNSLILKNW